MRPLSPVRQALIVLRKEWTDSLRDRRALVSIALSIVLGPLAAGLMVAGMAERQREAGALRLPIVGASHAPALVAWLSQQDGVTIAAGPADANDAVRSGAESLVLVIPPDFAERFRASRPAELRLVAAAARLDAQMAVDSARRLLEAYNAEVAAMRLIVRGVSPAAVSPLRVEQVDASTAAARAAQVLSFIPMFIIMAGFAGGMPLATDSTAGERERGSLEPLLVNPVPRTAFVAGKWMAAAGFAAVTTAATTALCLSLPAVVPLDDLGLRLDVTPRLAASLLGAALPLCLLSAALQLCVATLARSYKEAQTYMGLLLLLPAAPGMLHALNPLPTEAWMYAAPLWGTYVLMIEVLGQGAPESWAFAASGVSSCLVTAVLLHLTAGLFRRERIIFSR